MSVGDEAKARELFRKFHDKDARGRDIVRIGQTAPEFSLYIGPLYGISYQLSDEKLPLFHHFAKANRPLLYVSSDGHQIYILKGGYGFNDRGFFK